MSLHQEIYPGYRSGNAVALIPYDTTGEDKLFHDWIFRCDCGRYITACAYKLQLKEPTFSCGCLKIEELENEFKRVINDRWHREKDVAKFCKEKNIIFPSEIKPNNLQQCLIHDIENAAKSKRPFTITGPITGFWNRRSELSIQLQKLTRSKIECMAFELLRAKLIKRCGGDWTIKKKWLDVPDGPYSKGRLAYYQRGKLDRA